MIKKNYTKHNLKQQRKQGLIGLITIISVFAIFFLILNQFGPYKGISRLEYNMIIETIKEERERLIDIHTQFQTYTYIGQKYHIELLDSYISSKKLCNKSNCQKNLDKLKQT